MLQHKKKTALCISCITWISNRRYSSVVLLWQVVSGCLLQFSYGVCCRSIRHLWLHVNYRRLAVDLSNTCTCHHALQVFIHRALVLFSDLK